MQSINLKNKRKQKQKYHGCFKQTMIFVIAYKIDNISLNRSCNHRLAWLQLHQVGNHFRLERRSRG